MTASLVMSFWRTSLYELSEIFPVKEIGKLMEQEKTTNEKSRTQIFVKTLPNLWLRTERASKVAQTFHFVLYNKCLSVFALNLLSEICRHGIIILSNIKLIKKIINKSLRQYLSA